MTVSGSQLKSARLAIGLSRQRLAEQAGCSWQTIASYEFRENSSLPETAILARLVEALGGRGIQFRVDGVFIEKATPISRVGIHSEATA
jgi:transcriptional regulator with XRE-family HTH domain